MQALAAAAVVLVRVTSDAGRPTTRSCQSKVREITAIYVCCFTKGQDLFLEKKRKKCCYKKVVGVNRIFRTALAISIL